MYSLTKQLGANQMKLDWVLLRRQKEWLLQQPTGPEANGLVHLLDAIQDEAVASGEASEDEVFGEHLS